MPGCRRPHESKGILLVILLQGSRSDCPDFYLVIQYPRLHHENILITRCHYECRKSICRGSESYSLKSGKGSGELEVFHGDVSKTCHTVAFSCAQTARIQRQSKECIEDQRLVSRVLGTQGENTRYKVQSARHGHVQGTRVQVKHLNMYQI